MQKVLRLSYRFGSLNAQFQINKARNAVRFEAQNLLWDYEETNYHAQAFTKGLASLQFQAGDNFLIKVPSNQQAESFIVKAGTSNLGANLILSTATSEAELDTEIQNNNIKGIIFEPTISLGDQLCIDVLNKLIPELATIRNGQRVSSNKYRSLTALIQTNFFSYPGVFKFRSVLNYAEDRYIQSPQGANLEPISLPVSTNPIFITQPASNLGFRAGVLNSCVNGRYLVVVEPHQVNRVAEFHSNKVDLVATQNINNLHPDVNVFVEQGSSLFQGRKNRVEL